ncbi:Gfo/Idh/MocA family protein [Tamlana sp. I1]|uniref:Gfo/Idh/MocA family protein n=1 Tax=Tamlana sp. I1 TaxID=2762061 RepID=UPI00189040CE|nr:Gfo/Idh/MocA family oxidoreductase [Tamlana sp. I1]
MKQDKKIKWGIIGLGNIAHQFCADLLLVEQAELYAVASRSLEKAKAFAEIFQAQNYYGNYEDLFNNDDIDIIYIATPHDSHAVLSIQAMQHGKHVLCEKPIALNANEANAMVAVSKAQKVFFMEAFWTRFNPSISEALFKVKQQELGEIKYVNADFAFHVPMPTPRMIELKHGGGSLLEMGVYPLFLAYAILGKPKQVLAAGNFYENGADKQTSIVLQYNNAQAILHSSFVSPSNMVATISGTEGRINLNAIWHEAQSYSLIKNNHKVDYALPTLGKGFTYEIEECHKCIWNNQIESALWSHQNSLDLIEIVDAVREQTGLKFPSE